MSKRILIVDDDEDLSGEMAEFLEMKGYIIRTAAEGSEAVNQIMSRPFDVFLVDYKMAGLNGVEIARVIRNHQPQARIIMITGRPNAEIELRDEGHAELVDEVLGKPFEADDLLACIRQMP